MRIAIGADHAGVALKDHLRAHLSAAGHAIADHGVHDTDRADYPDVASAVAGSVRDGDADRAILVCGTGLGMAIAANKVRGVRAVTCHDPYSARMARIHNDAHVLTLGARVIASGLAETVADAFLSAVFEGGRHAARVAKIDAIEAQT